MPATPIVNGRIIKTTEFDLNNAVKSPNTYYVCTDSRKIYVDTLRNTRDLTSIEIISTEENRINGIKPNNNRQYYVWETNELWYYSFGWELQIGQIRSASSGYYYNQSNILTPTTDPNSFEVIDNNGLLKDGAVVVRDVNRIVKGKMYIDQLSNNLVFSGMFGGGIRFLPNGTLDSLGSLLINPNLITVKYNTVTGNIDSDAVYAAAPDQSIYVDVIQTIEDGYAKYIGEWNTTDDMYVNMLNASDPTDLNIHHYKVYHEGNLDPNSFNLSPTDILNKLNSITPQPIDLNVQKLNGKLSTDFSLYNHMHDSGDIIDFSQKVTSIINSQILGGSNKGIAISYDAVKAAFNFSANSFNLSLSGGATGSSQVKNLTSTAIDVTVDPTKHTHITDITTLTGYSTLKTEVDGKLNSSETVKTVTPNKILYLDANGYLPANITGNSAKASALVTSRAFTYTGGATGVGSFDGTANVTIPLTVDPTKHVHANTLNTSDVGVTIAPLDTNKLVPLINLPTSIQDTLQYQGTFDPTAGLPSASPVAGQYWVSQSATKDVILNSHNFNNGDWLVYNGTSWDNICTQQGIRTINGDASYDQVLTAATLKAIPTSYIDYTGNADTSKPVSGQILLADGINHFSGTSSVADKLIKAFKVTTTSDSTVVLDTAASTVSTDGTNDLSFKFILNSSVTTMVSSSVYKTVNIDLALNNV